MQLGRTDLRQFGDFDCVIIGECEVAIYSSIFAWIESMIMFLLECLAFFIEPEEDPIHFLSVQIRKSD